jgi:hypothetical protein
MWLILWITQMEKPDKKEEDQSSLFLRDLKEKKVD